MPGFPAFVLGAGLGTRLRPLTDQLPKPLIPLFGKPLVTFAFDHLLSAGADRFVVNTHHLPGRYAEVFGVANSTGTYRARRIDFRHESLLLDTGGGIKNAEDLLCGAENFVCYNGDILTDLPLGPALTCHAESGRIATLVLRSSGGPLHVGFDTSTGCVRDFRGRLHGGTGKGFLFTGLTVFSREIFQKIPAGRPVSIIDVYIELLRAGVEIGGLVIDEGRWHDLGTVESYLAAHAALSEHPPEYLSPGTLLRVGPGADVAPDARIEGVSSLGSRVVIGAGALVRDSVVWDGAEIPPHASIVNSVVRRGVRAPASLENAVV